MKLWLNDRLVDSHSAKISVFDRGILYGDGVFETMRSYAGIVFRLDAHLERLGRALKVVRIAQPYSNNCFLDIIRSTLEANSLKNASIRLTITRGDAGNGINIGGHSRPTVIITVRPFDENDSGVYHTGLRLHCIDKVRQNAHSYTSGIKSLNFLQYVLARDEAKRCGFDEAILKDTKGHISECATSNIFAVKEGVIITPSLSSGALPGITRGVVIAIAKRLKIKIKEVALEYAALVKADEVFLTNSLIEVAPAIKIDSRRIGNGKPGALTRLLQVSYQKEVILETFSLG